jgi:hypothetical protein
MVRTRGSGAGASPEMCLSDKKVGVDIALLNY